MAATSTRGAVQHHDPLADGDRKDGFVGVRGAEQIGSPPPRNGGAVSSVKSTEAVVRDLSVVIPCYNERGTVRQAIERVVSLPFVTEVVVVDDGSTDGSAAVLETISDARVRVIRHSANRGKGAALRSGFAEVSGPFVVVQDADLEYDPKDLERLLAPLRDERADVVFGSRFMGGEEHRVLLYWHSLGNRLLTELSNMSTNLNLTDMETCYKAFRLEVIRAISIEEDRFGFEPEVTAKVAALGCRIYEVGISYSGRTYAEGKKISWKDGVRAVVAIAKYSPIRNRTMRRSNRWPSRSEYSGRA
jgi:glycosyltransferase involved in cell wall biosynthesis